MFDTVPSERQAESPAKEPSPSHLNTANYGSFLKVSTDKLSVYYNGKGSHSNDVGAIQSNHPVPSDVLVYYYEVTVRDAGERGVIALGFADFHFRLSRQPGWEPNSYGYHADDGHKFHNSGKGEDYGPNFVQGDTVGAGIHLENREIFFTKNGKKLGVAFQNVKATLYPTIGLHSQNERVEVNFGAKPFQFDIEGMIAEEREQRQFAVLQSRIPASACHNIVCAYLMHYGYADTLKAFDEECFNEQSKTNEETSLFGLEDRKKVRDMIFEGNVEGVRQLLIGKSGGDEKMKDAFFHLSIQQFIELLRQEKVEDAVEHARSSLSLFQGHDQNLLQDVLALLAYRDPATSPMGHFMSTAQREKVADIINNHMLASTSSASVLEKILVQLCRVQAEIRRRNENKGEIFNINNLT